MNKALVLGLGTLAVATTGIQVNAAQTTHKEVKVTCSYLNVRTGPSTSHKILGTATKGKTFTALDSESGWYKIQYSGTRTGWISGKYVKTISESDDNETTVKNTADEFLNVRSGKGMSYDVLATIDKDDTATLLSPSGNWWKVKTKSGVVGYSYSKYLSKVNDTSKDDNKDTTKDDDNKLESMSGYGKVINCSSLRLRKGASTNTKVVTTLSRGTMFKITGKQGNFYKIKTSKGTVGYLHKSYVNAGCTSAQYKSYLNNKNHSNAKEDSDTSTNISSKRQAFINKIKAQVGKPYVYGAAGPNAFDCSGLVYYCYNRTTGKYVNRSAASLAYNGTYVSKGNLQPGDLVFFNSGTSRIRHVGVYIGNGQFIHAPSPGKRVRYENLYSSYYVRGYVTARRLSF